MNTLNVLKVYDGEKLTISCEGEIDSSTSRDLEENINNEIGNFKTLIIDLKDVDYISSAGLRIFISTQKKLNQDNIPMTIKNVNDDVNEIFNMTGLNKIFKIE